MLEQLLISASIWVTPVPLSTPATPIPVTVPVGLDTWVRPEGWSIPFYAASASGQPQRLLYNEHAWQKVVDGRWKRFGNSAQIESEIRASSQPTFPHAGNVYSSTVPGGWRLPGVFNKTRNPPVTPARFVVPPDALPAPGWDGHMTVQQPDGRVLETYATIRLSCGAIVALSYAVTDPRRFGDGFENGQTASMIPSYLGLLSDTEVASGEIRHALAITLPASMLSPQFRYPAYAMDRDALKHKPAYSGTVPMGSRLVYRPPAGADRPPLRTAEGRTIARAGERFGFIVVDRGGEGISLRTLRNPETPVPSLRRKGPELHADLRQIFAHLQLVEQASQTLGADQLRRSDATPTATP